MLMLGASAWITVSATFFVITSLLLVAVVLIQKPRGGGLTGAFGGGGGGGAQDVFGSKTGDALTWFTVSFFVIFLLLAMGLTWMTKPSLSTGPELIAEQASQPPVAPRPHPPLAPSVPAPNAATPDDATPAELNATVTAPVESSPVDAAPVPAPVPTNTASEGRD